MKKLFPIFLTYLCIQTADAQNLSLLEKNIVEHIVYQEKEPITLLEKLVNINSGTSHLTGIEKVKKVLIPRFKALGFKVRWVQLPSQLHRAGTLIAKHSGLQGRKMLLIGHLDTVFPQNSVFQKFKREQKYAIGPGVIDDKGGIVVILSALNALKKAGVLDQTSITVVLTGDEEDSGKPTTLSRKPLIDAAQGMDVALDFEIGIPHQASIARRGITQWTIFTQGLEGHSSEIFQTYHGDGAIFELTRLLNTIRTTLNFDQGLTFNPGLVIGGTTISYQPQDAMGKAFGKANVIAQTAMAQGDLRFVNEAQKKEAQAKIKQILDEHLNKTMASIKYEDGIPAMAPTEENLKLFKIYSQVSEDLEGESLQLSDPRARGAGDISFVASIVPQNLVGLGPMGTGTHSLQETLDLASLTTQAQRAAVLMYRLSQLEDSLND